MLNRFPKLEQIVPVYAVTVMMVYGWTIYRYIWELPSWLYFLSLTDVVRIYAYALSVNFFESLVVMLLPLLICIVLPGKWFRELFIARGATFIVALLGYLIYFSMAFKSIAEEDYPVTLIRWTPAILIALAVLVFAVGKIRSLSRIVEDFSARAVIFLYISIPISVLSLLYVIARNLLWRYLNG